MTTRFIADEEGPPGTTETLSGGRYAPDGDPALNSPCSIRETRTLGNWRPETETKCVMDSTGSFYYVRQRAAPRSGRRATGKLTKCRVPVSLNDQDLSGRLLARENFPRYMMNYPTMGRASWRESVNAISLYWPYLSDPALFPRYVATRS